jgi:hypothetical protein
LDGDLNAVSSANVAPLLVLALAAMPVACADSWLMNFRRRRLGKAIQYQKYGTSMLAFACLFGSEAPHPCYMHWLREAPVCLQGQWLLILFLRRQ